MNPERWRRLDQLFQGALEQEEARRGAFLDEACAGDAEMRREVESLLLAHAGAAGFLEERPAGLAAGARLGRYEVKGPLGAGGMGEVYRAWDESLGREVAVKVLPRRAAPDPDLLRRFELEARAVGALNHPNVLAVHDVGTSGGTPYVVSELLEGETLGRRMAGSPLPLRKCLDYAVQIARGLAAAHAKGIVHRDLKPENLFVTHDGRVKILDFGLAKLSHAEPPPPPEQQGTLSTPPSTTPGTILGTVGYMAPEQVRGLPADHRSDIFAVGAVLYEMIFGRKAFQGDTAAETMYAILKQDPLERTAPERVLPPGVERILAHCLEKSPEERFQSARDLAFHLEALSDASEAAPAATQVRRPAHGRRAGPALLAVLLAAGAGLWGWQAWRGTPGGEPPRARALTTFPGAELYPSLSPDGNHVAFTWTGPKQDNPDIYVQLIGAGSPLRLTTDPGNDYNPAWSPDGRSIAFLRVQSAGGDGELRLIPPLGGPERKLAGIHVRGGTFATPPHLAWCPDSSCLVVTDSPGEGKPDALSVISLETGEKRQLTDPHPPATGDTSPAVSPDGRWLVFRRNIGGLFTGELYRLPLGKGLTALGEPQRLTPAALDAEFPTWMPGAEEILFSARGSLWRLAVPGGGPPARLPFVGEDGLMPVVSRPQPGRPLRLVYVRRFEDFNLWRVETSGHGATASSPPVVSISSTRGDSMPQLSPDGRRVAFTSDRSGTWEIWLADPEGSNTVQLTSMGARASGFPHWSPDGERIAFHSNLEGQWEVFVIPAAGGKPRNLTSHMASDFSPSFSRDGRWIYFNSNRTGAFRIWKLPASGGDAVQVPNAVGWAPSESPDGAYVYYVQTLDGPSPLWRLPASGGVPVKILEGVVLANFVVLEGGIYYVDRVSGRGGMYYMDRPSGETRLQYFDFASRKSTTVARTLGHVDLPLTASSDGRTILYARMDSSVEDLMLVDDFR
jgi:eukaryotic-like serine/threonine-protein kinase